MRRQNVFLGGALIVTVAVSAVAAYVAAGATGLTVFEEESPVAEGDAPATTGGLAICVQAVDAQNPAERARDAEQLENAAKERIEAALPELAKHPYFSLAKYDRSPVVVDVGCPSPPSPAIMEPGNWHHGAPDHDVDIRPVAEKSPYRTFVYVLSDHKLISSLLGSDTRRLASQEFLCDDNAIERSCWAASAGVYVTAQEVASPDFAIIDVLTAGVGFEE